MVQQVMSTVYREIRGLHQAAYILALFTVGSQLLALIRDRVLAHQFGAGPELDLYYTAFRIPDVLYVLFASTLSVYVLIPFVSKKLETSTEAARTFLSQFLSLFVLVYGAVALIAIIYAPTILEFFFPGFSGSRETLVLLVRILLVQPMLLGISSLFGVITQIEHRFILYAISPLLYNLGIIVGAVFLYPHLGLSGLVLGVLLGAVGHVCIQLPSLLRSTLRPRFSLAWNVGDIADVLRTSVTRAVTLSLHQFVLLGLVGFASIMAAGSVSVLQFAYNLQSVPLAIIGVSYSVAAFPLLAQLYAEQKYEELRRNITMALKHILFWSVPVIALLVVIRAQFVRTILGSGAFDWNDTRLTASIFAVFLLSLTAQAFHMFIVRALYAVGNTRIPFYVTLGASALGLVSAFYLYTIFVADARLSLVFESVLRLQGVSGIEVLALPMGYSIALIVQSVVLLLCARKIIFVSLREIFVAFSQSCAAALGAGYVAYVTLNQFVHYADTDTLLTILAQGFVAVCCGMLTYTLLQYLFRNAELREIYSTLRRRFGRGDVVVPQDEDTLAL
jgi:putative peptidoglycan lipid II flippase